MNLKTTVFLVLLAGAGAGGWFWLDSRKPREAAANPSLDFLKDKLTPDKITRVEASRSVKPLDMPLVGAGTFGFLGMPILHGPWLSSNMLTPSKPAPQFVLEKVGKEWTLPGNWPVRPQETDQWLAVLGSLRSRFNPIDLGIPPDLNKYGLDDPLTIKVTVGDESHTLRFGEEPGDTNRFTRSTFVRLDDNPQVIKLGPGVLQALNRKLEHFQQRRLFPLERVARDEDGRDKVEQLDANAVEIETRDGKFAVAKKNKDWILTGAFKKKDAGWQRVSSEDRLDPDRRNALLRGFPELWAEKFVSGKSLDATGLTDPEYVITVTRPSGVKTKLLVGKVSGSTTKMVFKPSQPGMPPQPPQPVVEEYRFAKLDKNDQLFEIRADRLADLAPAFESLRDPKLAHFKVNDVTRVELKYKDQDIVLAKVKESADDKDKAKEKWQLEKPAKEDAEAKLVEELLDKLSSLQARDKEILDEVDPKTVGLDKPAGQIKLTLEEADKDAKKKDDEKEVKKKTRTITFSLGVKEKSDDKAYVRVDAWPRVNQVGDDLLKLLQRPALAYRHRRVLDLAAADIDKIEIERKEEKFTFVKDGESWKLTEPVKSDAEAAAVAGLVREVAKIDSIDMIGADAKPEDLDKTYGLAKPSLTVKLFDKKTTHTLIFGSLRLGKLEYYARLDKGPIFTLAKDLYDQLDRSSLIYRPKQLLKLAGDDITKITIKTDAPPYNLQRADKAWKISGPVDAEALPFLVDSIADALSHLKADRFEAHKTADPKKYGFDVPTGKIDFTTKDGKQHELTIGKKLDDGGRYAKLSGDEAVFVLNEKFITNFHREPFDLLDKNLLILNPDLIERIHFQGKAPFTLEPKKERWQVVGSPAPAFDAYDTALKAALTPWRFLRAEKIVALGPKIDWKEYGLDKPGLTITATFKADAGKKGTEHVIEIGKEAPGGARYVRVDKKDTLAILDGEASDALDRTYLDFLDPAVLKLDSDAIAGIQRSMPGGDLELAKREDMWQIVKPALRDADALTVADLLKRTAQLRAKRMAAYPAKDLQTFGLDKPAAVVTITLDMDGNTSKHQIKVGNLTKDAGHKDTDERYALIDDGKAVVVLPADLSRHLVSPVLHFADRNLVSFANVDAAELTHGPRKAVFGSIGGNWQMLQPIKAGAEDSAFEDLIRDLRRLRADEIVAEKGADLKKFGLAQPFLQWRFKAGEDEKLNLLVGAPENDKPGARRYAKLADKDQVFLLSAKLTAKLQEEYRSRKPWESFDTVGVEDLTVATPDKTFKLSKVGPLWIVAGEGDRLVKTAAVVDLLDALASLKVQHYLVDTKADLQNYGLTAPTWKITVPTPNGPRELLLGRYEGQSKRFYATVAGSGAVFVLDEATGARLARPLSAYVEAEKKKQP